MSWEQQIALELAAAGNIAVRYDAPQELDETQKATAKTNIGYVCTTASISGDDYKLVIPF